MQALAWCALSPTLTTRSWPRAGFACSTTSPCTSRACWSSSSRAAPSPRQTPVPAHQVGAVLHHYCTLYNLLFTRRALRWWCSLSLACWRWWPSSSAISSSSWLLWRDCLQILLSQICDEFRTGNQGLSGFWMIKSKTQCLHWWLELQHPGVTGFTGARYSSSVRSKARHSPPATWLLPPGPFIRHQVHSSHVKVIHVDSATATTTIMHPVQCCCPDCPNDTRHPAYHRHW